MITFYFEWLSREAYVCSDIALLGGSVAFLLAHSGALPEMNPMQAPACRWALPPTYAAEPGPCHGALRPADAQTAASILGSVQVREVLCGCLASTAERQCSAQRWCRESLALLLLMVITTRHAGAVQGIGADGGKQQP